jgi:phytoene desaturase
LRLSLAKKVMSHPRGLELGMRRLEGRRRDAGTLGASVRSEWARRVDDRAVVIGAGFGGMAAALRLRARGYRVTLIDQCDALGGRARTVEQGGFRFDTGPTVLCAPWLVEDLFALFGARLSDYVTLRAPSPCYRFHYADGTRFDYGPGRSETEAEIARLSPTDVAGYRSYLEYARRMHAIAFDKLGGQAAHDPTLMARQLPEMLRLQVWRSVWQQAASHFRDERLRWAFSMQPLLIGGHPDRTTSIYSLITHLEHAHGVWHPVGGMGALVAALGRLMDEVGVDLRLGTAVSEILVEDGAARGVRLATGEVVRSDLVVSNTDPLHLYGRMLPGHPVPRRTRRRAGSRRMSMGVFVLNLGTSRRWPDVAHHNVLFPERYRAYLDDLFSGRMCSDAGALYVSRPAASDPGMAPPGGDSIYVLCPVPNLQLAASDWEREGAKLRDRIVARLDASLLPGLARSIVEEVRTTPQDFATRFASMHGDAFSLAPHLGQTAYFRFHNRGEGLENLFLVGAGTHPGAGIPGVLQSARAIDALIPAPGRRA